MRTPPLPGAGPNIIASVFAHENDTVKAGQELFNIETRKRAVPISAPVTGTVERVFVSKGDVVATGDALATIAETGENAPTALANAEDAQGNETSHAELLVIGGGTGGYVAALYAAKMGKHVVLIERDKLGGTCLNRGCIPTKTLIASACLHRDIMHADQWGILIDGAAHPDMPSIIARKNRVVEELVGGIELLMTANGVRVLHGTAWFESNGSVTVRELDGTRAISFDDCIIATGSTTRELDIPGADLPQVLSTDQALDLGELPKSITIVGGGVTGMEFAFMYANLGAEVTVIARRPRILHTFDEHASQIIAQSAAEHGIRVETGSEVRRFSTESDHAVRIAFETAGTTRTVTGEYALIANGRAPVTSNLGLEAIGIAVDERTGAIIVDEHMRTNVEHLYAVGDVNGLVMLAHAASFQGRIAVDDILGRASTFSREVVPSVAYTDPEVATVGIGVDEAAKAPDSYTIGSFDFAHNGKALSENKASGMVSVVADSNGIVKGATIVGSHSSDLIGYLGLAVSSKLPGEEVRRAVFAHPTMSEAIHEAACDLTFGALHE